MIRPLRDGVSAIEPHDDSVAAERPVHPEKTDSDAEKEVRRLVISLLVRVPSDELDWLSALYGGPAKNPFTGIRVVVVGTCGSRVAESEATV